MALKSRNNPGSTSISSAPSRRVSNAAAAMADMGGSLKRNSQPGIEWITLSDEDRSLVRQVKPYLAKPYLEKL